VTKYSAKRKIGNIGEGIACQFLVGKGFKILERNYLRPWGEIDVVAEKGDVVRFVEVKAVSREMRAGISREMDYPPEELVTRTKLRKLAKTALLYMESQKDRREYQIDVVGVVMDREKRTAKCRLFEQVIDDEL
jgi:putative endonuclease